MNSRFALAAAIAVYVVAPPGRSRNRGSVPGSA